MQISLTKIYCTLVCLCCFSFASAQQYKVLQKSDKKAPAWYESPGSGYLVASVEDANMETARERCLESIRIQIIQAVAQNVEFTETSFLKQETRNQAEITEFVNVYTAEGSVQAASVPFLKGISLSKVEGVYWEKRQDKKSKQITYAYAIRYPFSKAEIYRLTKTFEEQDQQMVDKLETLESRLNAVDTVEEIDQAIEQIRPLVDYFFDRVRKQRAQSLQQNYRKLYSYISVEGEAGEGNSYKVWLNLQGRRISSSALPTLKSVCASRLQAIPQGKEVVVTYDNSDCLMDEENSVEVTFRVQGKMLKHSFFIEGSPQY